MPDVIEQLRAELRDAVADRPAEEPAAYARIARRAARRRAAIRVSAAMTLAVGFAAVLALPRYLASGLDGSDLAGKAATQGGRPAAMPYVPPCEPDPPARNPGIAPEDGPSIEASKGVAGRACREPAFDIAPASTTPGTTVEVSGSCGTVLEGQASTVSVLLSLEDSKRYSGLVGADGRFRVPVELPWRLLPASYEVSVSCAVEHGRAGLSGAALLGDRVLHVAKPVSAATTARGEPEPAALSASLRPGDTGQEVLLRGRGCYLSALRGSPGLVRIVVDPVLGDRPEELRSLLSSWRSPLRIEPAPDGSWRATLDDLGTDKEPSRPYDIYALCTDDLGGLGFVYTPVYRVEFDRIRVVSGWPA